MERAKAVQYASRLSLVHGRFEKFSTLQLAQLFSDRLNIHHISIVGFNMVEGLDHFSNTLSKSDLKVNKVNSVFRLQKSSIFIIGRWSETLGVLNLSISDCGDRDPRNSLPRKRFDLMPNCAAKCNFL